MKRNQGPDDINRIKKRFFSNANRGLSASQSNSLCLACVSGALDSDDKATDKSSMFQLCVLWWMYFFFSLLLHLLREHDLTQKHVQIKLK